MNLLRVLTNATVSECHHNHHHAQRHRPGAGNIRNVFPELPPDHLLRDQHILIILPVVDGEPQTDEVGENGCAALLRLDRRGVRRRGELAGEREAAVE